MGSFMQRAPSLAMLHAAALTVDCKSSHPEPIHPTSRPVLQRSTPIHPIPSLSAPITSKILNTSSSSMPLSSLLNPTPLSSVSHLTVSTPPPPGFVIGKDGKIKKKRGRKPTPGMTDEDRRQARLLKNRRTAETSRRRKLALMNRLTSERDEAKLVAEKLRKHNDYLTARLAKALGCSVEELLKSEPAIALRTIPTVEPDHSDVSRPQSVADSDSDSDRNAKNS